MGSVNSRILLDDLELTKKEEFLLRRVVGLWHPEPRGYWGRFFQAPLRALSPKETLSSLIVLVAITAIIFDFLLKWPLVGELLGVFSVPILLFSFIIVQGRSNQLIRKLYHALEKARVPGQ